MLIKKISSIVLRNCDKSPILNRTGRMCACVKYFPVRFIVGLRLKLCLSTIYIINLL